MDERAQHRTADPPSNAAEEQSGSRETAARLRLVPRTERGQRGWAGPPRPPTSLIGRERELASLRALLGSDAIRLVTLTGPGGVGKTRLALAVAAELNDAFADGIVYVTLASLRDPDLVAAAIAEALRVHQVGDQPLLERLVDRLDQQQLLLILDNFEQVIGATPTVSALVAADSGSKVLVTSRETLRIAGEHIFVVPPLTVPANASPSNLATKTLLESEAVRLFVARAHSVGTDFALTEANAEIAAAICRRLDGLPLAIELAAARLAHLTPATLLARLERRLPLLTSGARDQPDRHQTMRAAIAWSYDLLPPEEQMMLRRLAVFSGGCTLEAADAVTGPDGSGISALDGIAALLDKSLLRLEEHPDGQARYVMLETVREHALDQLSASGEAEAMRRRHAEWCVVLAERASAELNSSESDAWRARLAAEHDNLRAALEWAVESEEPETGLRLGGALWSFWFATGHLSEGRERLRRALATIGSENVAPGIRAGALTGLGSLAVYQGDFAQAGAPLDEALALWRQLGDRAGEAHLLHMLAALAEYRGDDEQATSRYEAALALFRELGATRQVGSMLENLADAAFRRGELSRSQALASEALAIGRTTTDVKLLTLALVGAAQIASARGEHAVAAELLAESLTRTNQAGYWIGWADTLGGCAAVAVAAGQTATAAQLLSAAMAVCEEIGMPRLLHQAQYRRTLAAVQMRLDEEEFALAWSAGRELTHEEVRIAAEDVLRAGTLADAGVSASPAERFGLTPREHQVLRLLVEGQSDKEIGEALFISHRTVMAHVAHILAKLDVPSRAAAAQVSLRQGLL